MTRLKRLKPIAPAVRRFLTSFNPCSPCNRCRTAIKQWIVKNLRLRIAQWNYERPGHMRAFYWEDK